MGSDFYQVEKTKKELADTAKRVGDQYPAISAALTAARSVVISLEDELAAVKRELDAAVEDLPKVCFYCKHWKGWGCTVGGPCEDKKEWEWRGPQEGGD